MTEHPAKKRKMELDGGEAGTPPEKNPPTTTPSSESDSVAPESSSSPTPAKYTRGDLVTPLVGPDEQELVVCGTPLAETSEFFRTALKKEWKEGQKRMIRLPEEDITLITRYFDFVFGQSLPSKDAQTADHLEKSTAYDGIFQLYALGERMLDASIRNTVVKESLRLVSLVGDASHGFLPSRNCIKLVYKETSARSAARRLLVDLHVAYGLSETLEHEKVLPEYMCDLAKAYSRKIENHQLMRRSFPRAILKADDYFV